MNKDVYDLKKDDRLCLDQIYTIQGIAGGDWWERIGDDLSENIRITRNIKITITWTSNGRMRS